MSSSRWGIIAQLTLRKSQVTERELRIPLFSCLSTTVVFLFLLEYKVSEVAIFTCRWQQDWGVRAKEIGTANHNCSVKLGQMKKLWSVLPATAAADFRTASAEGSSFALTGTSCYTSSHLQVQNKHAQPAGSVVPASTNVPIHFGLSLYNP